MTPRNQDWQAAAAVARLEPMRGSRAEFGFANTSLWHESICQQPSLPIPGDLPNQVDVAIIGAGLTGLWSAYYVSALKPSAKIAIFEANHVAFGASGRAGGWAIGTLDGQASWLEGLSRDDAGRAVACVTGTLDEIEHVISSEQIACGYARGGMVRFAARDPTQASVLSKYRKMIRAENADEETPADLNSVDVAHLTSMRGAYAGVAFPHCAVLNPAKLAIGLARVLARRGVSIFERCQALNWDGNTLQTEAGSLTADAVVPALEGYSGSFPETRERVIPVYSHIIATEPLSENLRASLGLAERQAFADCSRISTYGQITEDNRVVLGALASYPFAGRLTGLRDEHVNKQYALVHSTLTNMWPQLAQTPITHAWSGALGVPRHFRPMIVEDRSRRVIWGGGYTSRGLAASNLFGRTIAEIICGLESDRTRCPWVMRDGSFDRLLPKWEPEPTRWLAIASITAPGRLQELVLQSSLSEPFRRGFARLMDSIPSFR